MRKRLIPTLLLDRQRRLVKTVQFGERTYVGDPFNVVRLFNEKEVDELCLLDIDATVDGRGPDLAFIGELASECFAPLSYGGGITSAEQCEVLNRLGIEKFVLGHGSFDQTLIRTIVQHFGSQAVCACVDVASSSLGARCVSRSGRNKTQLNPLDRCLELQDQGVGEIIIQSVDRDGTRRGYDLNLIRHTSSRVGVPVVALGGAGTQEHLSQALEAGASAAASGSAFVFIGPLRAVLITYPAPADAGDRSALQQ